MTKNPVKDTRTLALLPRFSFRIDPIQLVGIIATYEMLGIANQYIRDRAGGKPSYADSDWYFYLVAPLTLAVFTLFISNLIRWFCSCWQASIITQLLRQYDVTRKPTTDHQQHPSEWSQEVQRQQAAMPFADETPPPSFWDGESWFITTISTGVLMAIGMADDQNNGAIQKVIMLAVGAPMIGMMYLMGRYIIVMTIYLRSLKPKGRAMVLGKHCSDESKSESGFFSNLVNVNLWHLDRYYYQTQVQNARSFAICVFVALSGFAFTVYALVQSDLQGGALQSSTLLFGGVGVLIKFISVVFFYIHNQSVRQTSSYHQKLVLTQNIALAMKATEEVKDSENKRVLLERIVEALIKDVNTLLIADPQPGKPDRSKMP